MKKNYECDICGKVLDEEQNFKSHNDSVHEGKKPYECEHCHEGFDEEKHKFTLNQFMRGRNLINVNIATKYLMKNKTSKAI